MESTLLALILLACPVGMGLMMWFMSKGMGGKKDEQTAAPRSVEQLREEQRRLNQEMNRLEERELPVSGGRS